MDRRKFIGWFSVGALASSLPVVIAACSSSNNQPLVQPEKPTTDKGVRKDGFQSVGTVQELTEKGSILDKKNLPKPVLVLHNPSSNNLVAVNPTCTHQGCSVAWEADTKTLSCPCHGSKFNPDGSVLKGPATKPLESFTAKEENGLVLVKVG